MKLRNKKTGEIFDALVREKGGGGSYSLIVCDAKAYEQSKSTLDATHFVLDEYDSLAELNEEWEDYEESEEYWHINAIGKVGLHTRTNGMTESENLYIEDCQLEIGNYFKTKEEAEKAVEKLKAWKRLKDKGFRFDGWEDLQAEMSIDDLTLFNRDVIDTDNVIGFRMDDYHDCIKDLNTCFGGEE